MMSARSLIIMCLGVIAPIALAACGDTSSARDGSSTSAAPAASADVRSAGGFRIIGTPIAAVATTPSGITTANVTLRTNKPLPLRERRVAANIRLDGASGASPAIRVGDATHHCYIQSVDEFPHPARTGDRALLTLRIPRIKRQMHMVVRFATATDSKRRYKRLCGHRKIFDDPDA